MVEDVSLPRVVHVNSTKPVSDLEAFDMMSRFLAAEKAKQLSLDFAGQSYLASSSQTWNDLRLSCNSLLEENDPRREPVAPWKDESLFVDTPQGSKSMATTPGTDATKDTDATEKSDKEARRSAKKAKKQAKKAKKEAKKAKKEAKKAKKDSRKRKRLEDSENTPST